MPDKDFDKLFKDSFMDAEIEPSADLWGNIAEQLAPKKKRAFPVLWMAAASVVVVVSVLLFTKNGEKVYLQGANEQAAAMNSSEITTPVAAKSTEVTNVIPAVVLPESNTPKHLVKRTVNKLVTAEVAGEHKNIITGMQPSMQVAHLPIKKAEAKPLDVTQEIIGISQVEDQMVHAKADIKTVDSFEQIGEGDSSKKSIRNVGDLINYVVDKVDKRDKKLIKFDTDDDDNSSIIGLNIGFLKLNKKNNK